MSSITAYVLKPDGSLDCTRTGDVDSVMLAIDIEKKNYTLQPPPDTNGRWRWVNNEWIADEATE